MNDWNLVQQLQLQQQQLCDALEVSPPLIIRLLSSIEQNFVGLIKSRFVFLDRERVTRRPRLSSALIYRLADRLFPTSLGRVRAERCPDLQPLSLHRCL